MRLWRCAVCFRTEITMMMVMVGMKGFSIEIATLKQKKGKYTGITRSAGIYLNNCQTAFPY